MRFTTSSISGSGKWPASTTLSRNRVQRCVTFASRSQSIDPSIVRRRPFVKLRNVDRAEIARVVEMQLLLAARVAGEDRPHRLHHVIVPIDLVDKDDAGLGVFVSRGDDAVPDVRCDRPFPASAAPRSCSRKGRPSRTQVCRRMSRSSRRGGDKRHSRRRSPDRRSACVHGSPLNSVWNQVPLSTASIKRSVTVTEILKFVRLVWSFFA